MSEPKTTSKSLWLRFFYSSYRHFHQENKLELSFSLLMITTPSSFCRDDHRTVAVCCCLLVILLFNRCECMVKTCFENRARPSRISPHTLQRTRICSSSFAFEKKTKQMNSTSFYVKSFKAAHLILIVFVRCCIRFRCCFLR